MTSTPHRRQQRQVKPSRVKLLEPLETRQMLANWVVNSLADDGPGSLRDTIWQADAGDTIDLTALSGSIELQSVLHIAKSLTINGPGPSQLTLDAKGLDQVIRISPNFFSLQDVSVTLRGFTVTGGNATYGGGIIANGDLTLDNMNITANKALQGGGGIIFHAGNPGDALTIINSNISNNDAAYGAGLYIHGDALISNSSIVSNDAFQERGIIADNISVGGEARGGGIFFNSGSLTLNSVTIAGNTVAAEPGLDRPGLIAGAGLFVEEYATSVILNHVTLANNQITASSFVSAEGPQLPRGPAIASNITGVVINNSLIAGNTGATSELSGSNFIASRSLLSRIQAALLSGSSANNLVGSSAQPINALLGAMQVEGILSYLPLLSGSPAINSAGDSALGTDQLGNNRHNAPDMGAFEWQASPSPTPTPTPTPTPAPTITQTSLPVASVDARYTTSITLNANQTGVPVSVSIISKPAWLSVGTPQNGVVALTGTPRSRDVGNRPVVLRLTAGTQTADVTLPLRVNTVPSLASTSLTTGQSNIAYTGQLQIIDPDAGANATMTVLSKPNWLTITQGVGNLLTLTGTPRSSDAGENQFLIRLDDGFSQPQFLLNVLVNLLPRASIDRLPGVSVGEAYSEQFTVTDPDSNAVPNVTVLQRPQWMNVAVSGNRVTLTGTPNANQGGASTLNLRLTDAHGSRQQVFNFNVNQLPTVNASAFTVVSNTAFSRSLQLSDPDGESGSTISASVIRRPTWLNVGPVVKNRIALTGTPPASAVSSALQLRLSDGLGTREVTININVNRPPTVDQVSLPDAEAGESYNASLVLRDPDGDTNLSAVVVGKPAWMTVISSNHGRLQITGTPPRTADDRDSLTLDLSDGSATTRVSLPVVVNKPKTVFISPSRELIVFGREGADTIETSMPTPEIVRITLNGLNRDFAIASFKSIVMNTYGGHDTIIANSLGEIRISVDAGIGNDSVATSEGDDFILAGPGDDVIVTGGGADVISGDIGNDTLSGGAGRDTLYGDDGIDHLIGGPGTDELWGGKGDDLIYARDSELDKIISGEGRGFVEKDAFDLGF